jgi:hypothetical protein
MAAPRWNVVFTDESISPETAARLRETLGVRIPLASPAETALRWARRWITPPVPGFTTTLLLPAPLPSG